MMTFLDVRKSDPREEDVVVMSLVLSLLLLLFLFVSFSAHPFCGGDEYARKGERESSGR